MSIRSVGASVAPLAPGRPSDTTQDAKLKKSAQQLEGVFVQQMFKAMRDTVPSDGMFSGGSGEQMFTGLLDERMAADTPAKWNHGLSEAIYKHLRQALPGAQASETSAAAHASTAASVPLNSLAPATRSTPE